MKLGPSPTQIPVAHVLVNERGSEEEEEPADGKDDTANNPPGPRILSPTPARAAIRALHEVRHSAAIETWTDV